jgi:hypothetical protein
MGMGMWAAWWVLVAAVLVVAASLWGSVLRSADAMSMLAPVVG